MLYWWSAGPVIFARNLFSRTVIYISLGLHLLKLHMVEKWAASEYSTSPAEEQGGGGGGGGFKRFPSPQVERITITIKNQKPCVSIKQLPITPLYTYRQIMAATGRVGRCKTLSSLIVPYYRSLFIWDIMQWVLFQAGSRLPKWHANVSRLAAC